MSQRKPHRSQQGGFTLIEIIISVVLLGILSVVGTTMITSSVYTTKVISTQHLAYSEARYAIERMGREIRELRYNMTTDSLSITTWTASQFTFDKEPITGTTGVPVSFQYAGGTLSMSYSSSSPLTYTPLARNLGQFSFEYLKDDGVSTATTVNDIRLVRITLKVTPPGAQALSLLTMVNLRNL